MLQPVSHLYLAVLLSLTIFFSITALFTWLDRRRLICSSERQFAYWAGRNDYPARCESELGKAHFLSWYAIRLASRLRWVFPETAEEPAEQRVPVIVSVLASIIVSVIFGYVLFASLMGAVIGPVIAVASFRGWSRRIALKKRARLRGQLPEVLGYIAAALSAGSGFSQALGHAARESTPPISSELKRVVDQVGVGVGLDEALIKLNERLGIAELRPIVLALSMQRRAGGNLVQLLENAREMLKERSAFDQQVLSETAQARLSGMVVGLLPVIVLSIVAFMDPGFVAPLFQTGPGLLLLALAALADGLGFFVIKRVLKLEY